MTTSLRRSRWSAICAVICAVVLGASPLAFAPAASAHGGLTCEDPPFIGGSNVSIYCEGHGIAILTGECGSLTAHSITVYNHHGGTAWVDCSTAGTVGPMYNVTLRIAYYAGEGPEAAPPPEEEQR